MVRTPSYPGGWVSPTISVDVTYPTTTDNVIIHSSTQTIKRFNVTYALAPFTAPGASDPETSAAVIVSTGSAEVNATVLEPVNKTKFRETTCTASVMLY